MSWLSLEQDIGDLTRELELTKSQVWNLENQVGGLEREMNQTWPRTEILQTQVNGLAAAVDTLNEVVRRLRPESLEPPVIQKSSPIPKTPDSRSGGTRPFRINSRHSDRTSGER